MVVEFQTSRLFEEKIEISAAVGEEFFEGGHLIGVDIERDDVAVDDVFMEPRFEAVATPAATEFAELIAEFGKDGGFLLAHRRHGLTGRVEGMESPAGAVYFLIELAAPD